MSRFTHFFRKFFVTEKQTPQTFSLLECMVSAWFVSASKFWQIKYQDLPCGGEPICNESSGKLRRCTLEALGSEEAPVVFV